MSAVIKISPRFHFISLESLKFKLNKKEHLPVNTPL